MSQNQHLKYGRDVKVCYVATDFALSNPVQSALSKIAIDIVETRMTLGNITHTYAMIGYDNVGKTRRSRSIFAGNQETIAPRGSIVQNVGNKGVMINIKGYITGQFFNRRDKLAAILQSGEVLKLYLPYYQRMNSAKNVSAINKTSRTNNFFYVKPVGEPIITDSESNIGSCSIDITFQEVPNVKRQKGSNILNTVSSIVGTIGDTFTDFEVAADTARQALLRFNAITFAVAQTANNAGQDVRSLLGAINSINNNIDTLLQAPSVLISNYKQVFGELLTSFLQSSGSSNIATVKNTQNSNLMSISQLASFNDDKTVKSSIIYINGRQSTNLKAIKENIVEGKIVFASRIISLLMLTSLIDVYYFENLNQVNEVRSILQTIERKIFYDTQYNGLNKDESFVQEYTNSPLDQDLALKVKKIITATYNILRNIEQNISNSRTDILTRDCTLLHVIYRYYNSYVTRENIDDIVKNFMYVNNIADAQDIIYAGTSIYIPEILIN